MKYVIFPHGFQFLNYDDQEKVKRNSICAHGTSRYEFLCVNIYPPNPDTNAIFST